MKAPKSFPARWCWLLPALSAVLGPPAGAQNTIVYVHLPLSNPNGDTNRLSYDSLGTQVGPDLPLVINGQPVCTFSSGPLVLGQPTRFVIQASSTSTIIGQQPYLDFPDDVWVVALAAGQEIGSGAAGYNWFDGSYDHPLLAAYVGSATMGEPWLSSGYFAGVESAYIGFSFQRDGQGYYGWIRAGSPIVGLNGGWVYDYAYQTLPNTPIKAGQWRSPLAFAATLSGSNEVPPNASTLTATGSFTLDESNLTYSVLLPAVMTPKSAGIYGPTDPCSTPGRLLTNLNLLAPIFTNPFPPIVPFEAQAPVHGSVEPPGSIVGFVCQGQVMLSDTQVLELLAGRLCVNVPSTAYPRGEVRGAILPTGPVQLAAVLAGTARALRNRSVFHASAAFTLAGDNLAYSLAVDTNVVVSSAGVFIRTLGHPGSPRLICPLDSSLGVQVPAGGFPGEPGSPGQILYTGSATLTDREVEQLKRGECYLRLGAAAFAGGELCGRITALDSNHDGLPDYVAGYLAQICPCAGAWNSHSQYAKTVSRVAASFASSGLITMSQYCQILRQAQRSDCGKPQ